MLETYCKVPGCDFCSISATIVPGPDQECTTPVLDNPGDNDLQTCDENVFSGPVIGEVSIGIVILSSVSSVTSV